MAFKRAGVRIPLAPPQKYHTSCMVFFVYFQGDCANLEKFVPRRCRANPCGLTLTLLRKRPRYTSFESPWLHQKNIIHLVWYFFLCKDKGISVIYHGVALQHEPLRADNKRRETQARGICGHRVQFHSQQIRHEVSAKGAVQCTIC